MVCYLLFPPTSSFDPSDRKYIMFLCRFVIGIQQAFVCIYSQVWININIPAESKGIYMAALQGMLPIGIVVGQTMTIALGDQWFCAFVIQATFLVFMTVLFFFMPARLDINFSKSNLKRNSEQMFTSNQEDNED